MIPITYEDFELSIERDGSHYRARVVRSPAGQSAGTFTLPSWDLELENLQLRLAVAGRETRRDVRRLAADDLRRLQGFGERLFDTVFDGEVRDCFMSSLDKTRERGEGLRLRLRIADQAPELTDLPWEYLYNSRSRFLCTSIFTPVVRCLDLPESEERLTVALPLRMLVVISNPSDHAPLDVEKEWSGLRESLSSLMAQEHVAIDRVDQATLGALRSRLESATYHIVHFIGHGGFDAERNAGVLIFEDDDGKGRPVSGRQLGVELQDYDNLRLAVLNACEGARSAPNDPFTGIAQGLMQVGIPAVIAMRCEITDTAAGILAKEFYRALALGYPVDAALAKARQVVHNDVNDTEWGTPLLYMRSIDGHIFDIPAPGDDAAENKNNELGELYAQALVSFNGGHWQQAADEFAGIVNRRPDYKDAAQKRDQARQHVVPTQPAVPTLFSGPQPAPTVEPPTVVEPPEDKRKEPVGPSVPPPTRPPWWRRPPAAGAFLAAGAMVVALVVAVIVWRRLDQPSPVPPTVTPTQTPPAPPTYRANQLVRVNTACLNLRREPKYDPTEAAPCHSEGEYMQVVSDMPRFADEITWWRVQCWTGRGTCEGWMSGNANYLLGRSSSEANKPSLSLRLLPQSDPARPGSNFEFRVVARNEGAKGRRGSITVSAKDVEKLSSDSEACSPRHDVPVYKPPTNLSRYGGGTISSRDWMTELSLRDRIDWPKDSECIIIVRAQVPTNPVPCLTFFLRTATRDENNRFAIWPLDREGLKEVPDQQGSCPNGRGPDEVRDQQGYPALRWTVRVQGP